MKKRSVWLAVAAVALISAWAGFRFSHFSRERTAQQAAAPLAQLMAAPLADMEGKSRALNEWRGKILVINFWASWCPPCLEEMPAFSTVQRKLGNREVQFIGIAIDSPEQVAAFARVTPVAYPLLIGSPATLSITAGLGNASQGLPFTLMLDRQGHLLSSKLGRLTDEELDARLLPLLKSKP